MDRGSYELRVAPSARRGLQRVPDRYALAIEAFLASTLVRVPWRVGKRMREELSGWRCARVDVYRIIYWIDESAGVVQVERIEHRADVYRPR